MTTPKENLINPIPRCWDIIPRCWDIPTLGWRIILKTQSPFLTHLFGFNIMPFVKRFHVDISELIKKKLYVDMIRLLIQTNTPICIQLGYIHWYFACVTRMWNFGARRLHQHDIFIACLDVFSFCFDLLPQFLPYCAHSCCKVQTLFIEVAKDLWEWWPNIIILLYQ